MKGFSFFFTDKTPFLWKCGSPFIILGWLFFVDDEDDDDSTDNNF